jgi:hypothetical protein
MLSRIQELGGPPLLLTHGSCKPENLLSATRAFSPPLPEIGFALLYSKKEKKRRRRGSWKKYNYEVEATGKFCL